MGNKTYFNFEENYSPRLTSPSKVRIRIYTLDAVFPETYRWKETPSHKVTREHRALDSWKVSEILCLREKSRLLVLHQLHRDIVKLAQGKVNYLQFY